MTPCSLEHGCQTHLLEHVEPIVARGTVRPQRYGDPASPHFSHWCDTGAQLEIRAKAVKYLDVVCGEQLLFMFVIPEAMRRTQKRRGQTATSQGVEIVEAEA